MKIVRRRFLRVAAGAAALPALSRVAAAQAYPTGPVRIIVGFAAGGPLDTTARLVALGQSFVVENRPGASSNIAVADVVHSKPDGYTLLMCASVNAWNAALYDNLTFDFTNDITPVASVVEAGGIMGVNPSVPAKTLLEFIAYAKANPGKLNMATAGPGSGPGLWGELFKTMARVNLVTVNYTGAGPAKLDLMAGRVQVMFDVPIGAMGPIRSGKLRAYSWNIRHGQTGKSDSCRRPQSTMSNQLKFFQKNIGAEISHAGWGYRNKKKHCGLSPS